MAASVPAATASSTSVGAPVSDPTNPASTVMPPGADGSPTGIIANQVGAPAAGAGTGTAPDVGNWYRTVYGRDPDQGGLNYWNKQLSGGADPSQVFKNFQSSGASGQEANFNGNVTQAQAGTYNGPGSAESNTNVDEWARNNGVTMTPQQKAQYESAYNTASTNGSVQDSKSVYAQFLQDHPDARNLSYSAAQQLNYQPPAGTAASVAPGTGGTSTAATYNAAQLGDPTKWNVAANQTAQGQMAGLIDPNSQYYQAWAHAGAADAAARGFTGNSSIRDSAILDSVMRGATPIATNDANTFAKAGSYNADINNQFAVKNVDAQNAASQFNSGQMNQRYGVDLNNATQRYGIDTNNATQRYGIDTNANTSLATANISAGTQKYVAGLSSDTQKAVAGLNNASQAAISTAHDTNSTLIANNQNAATDFQKFMDGVINIQAQKGVESTAMAVQVKNLTDVYNARQESYKAAGPGIISTQVASQSTSDPAVNTSTTTDTSTDQGVTKDGVPNVSKMVTFAKSGDKTGDV